MVGGILFFVIELKLLLDPGGNNLTQVFLELLCEMPLYLSLSNTKRAGTQLLRRRTSRPTLRT